MAGVEDEDEYRDALGAADPPPSSPSPTSKLKSAAAAGGGGFGRRLFASVPLPASLSAAIGRFSSPKPPAPNVDLGLLLHADPATPADGNGTPASDAASTISSPHLLPLASLQPQHGEDRVAGLGAGMEEEGLWLVPAEEQVWPTAEDWEKECLAVDECSANRNDLSLRGQEEEGEQCQGDELGAAVDGCMVQDQEEVVEQEGATEDCAAVVEHQSNNAAVEQCAVDETRAVKDDNAWEVNEKVTEQEGAVSILDAAEDVVAVGSQEEEEDVVVAEQGEDVISVQDQLEVVELCTGDQLRTTTEDNSGQDKDLVEQEEATKYYTALEAVEQCTNDGSKAVKDGNIVEEEERAVALEGALGVLDAAKDGAPVESQEEDEDVISVQDQHKVVDQCSGDQLITAADDNAAQGQDVVKHEGATEYYIAVEDVEQCTNDGSRAVKDGNVVEEKDKVAEQVVSFGVLYAAKDCATGESQDEGDVVLAEQIEDSISMQDHHKVVELFTGDQLKTTADDNAAQDQEVLEQEGATECYTTLGAVEECTDDESRVAKDGRVVEEKERPVKHEGAVGVLNAARDNIIVESQEEYVVVAEQCEGDISVHNQDKEVEQCTSGQLKTTMDDNAAEGQEVVDQESAIVDRHATIDDSTVEDQEKEVKQSAGDESRAAKDGNSVEVVEKMVDQDDVIDKRGVIKDGNGVVLLEENSVVVVEQGGDATSLPDVGNVVEQHTSDQLRATTDDNAAENQEIEEQGAIVERVVNTTDGIRNEDQEKEVEQSSGDKLTLTKDENGVEDNEKGDQEDIIDKQGVIKDGGGVDSQEEDVVVTEQGGDGISERDVGNVVKPCTSDQRTTMGGNSVECQEVVEKEGAIFERGAMAGGTAVEDQDKEVEQSEGDGSRVTKDENVVENATDKQGAPKDGSGVESQEDEDVVAAEQGGDDISVRDEGNVMEQCTCDQQRTTTDDNAAEDQEVVEQEGVVSILGAAKVDIAMESLQEEDIMVQEQVEDGVYVQDQDKVVEQCTSDQLRTSTDGCAEEDQEASRENIGFAAGCSQRPGKLNCRFYMLNGSCSYGSSCHFNHPQLKAKLEVSSSEHRNREVEFLELNRVGLPIREGARKCAYYMRNGTCRYGKKCCFNHPEQVLDAQLHMPTGWDDTNLQSSPHSKKSVEHATINDISSGSEILPPNGSEILPPNILRMLLPPQNVTPCTEEKEMKVKKDPDWSSASDDSDGCCSADSSGGPLCKQEHVDYPERPECLFLQRFGNCKFASASQYYHPKDKFPSRYHPKEKFPSRYDSKVNFQSRYLPKRDPPLAELKVYTDRPGQPECPFYMKTGSCKFKADCKFHHPKDLTPSMQGPASPKRSVVANEHHPAARIPSMQGPASPKRSVAANEHHPAARIPSMQGPASPKGSVTNEHHPAARVTLQDHMYQQHKCPERPSEPDCRYYMQFGKCKFQSACIFYHPKDILSSGWCPAACPFYMKTGTCQFGSACEFSHPKDRCATTGKAIDDGTDNEHGFDPKSENVLQQQGKKIYPQRPGEPECSHYMKHGYCKFQKSCIFHHPTDRLSNK